ncbi:MAG: hypothetical protein A2W86_14130 [Bacteroidetes bacterium GWD2_45_23]|jgi:hydroxyethylthiazole kinase-like uncharacterized protein yjeF|nr:MAG: hypothetical protein A2W87_03560 [Bacteroidetes bacterium GWC2_46_850]OFX84775.1 MAG: hypothetical protein A2W86_14130 [Bacteroidetes bacterium GWD2_45_23]HBB00286.1 bifunctional ADP-dependent NAD(P)H-hydrate dehydratase/NAD(P)H-hydrate epimerase [Porphyromonadaceae bacterium]HCC18361.1 bifunctional ADP-dependent NAD(P)H-hydrate dehydratase/NAD(P)H-hydrate epimerase [Porphyromonadaceae bacterium]
MKILTAEQIRRIDGETIKREGIPSLELMKRAATAFYNWFTEKYPNKRLSLSVFAGVGNNGGDGMMIARLLHKSGYNVKAFIVEYSQKYTEDTAHNLRRLKADNVFHKKILTEKEMPDLSAFDLVIDGIFGTGLSREVSGIAATVIQQINNSRKPVISIDVPSGLFLNKRTPFAVHATETITFQIPKLALYLPENQDYTGNVTIVPIGLNKEAIEELESDFTLTERGKIRSLLKPLSKFAHKGTEGHALIIGGSLGKTGSVCLAAKASLKTGCGLITAYLPKCGVPIIQSNFPEAMAIEDGGDTHLTSITYDLHPNAIGIGVGMGQHQETQLALHGFLQKNSAPLVIDADGLNILSQHPDWLSLLPPKTILTPHPKELSRLIGAWCDDYEKIQKTRLFAQEYDLIVVVKGAYSLIIAPGHVYLNSTGCPALATAGSGDVLTGMITSLLAQGYDPLQAARVGVYLHGLTAEIGVQHIHPRAFIASDIIENIGNAYRELEKNN